MDIESSFNTEGVKEAKRPNVSAICKNIVKDLINWASPIETKEELDKALLTCRKKYKHIPSKRDMLDALSSLNLTSLPTFKEFLTVRSVRSQSGILNITVSMPPFAKGYTGPYTEKTSLFSCKYNCYFCPNEPGMPRSYLSNEDVFMRAAPVGFDTVKQVHKRLDDLKRNGHTIDKLEYRCISGSFSCYDHSVADEFIRDLYYATNTYNTEISYDNLNATNPPLRAPLSIEEEQAINVTAEVHVVGLGVETRPDEITIDEIKRFRRYGVTRVELGVQHTDDALLRKVNRGHGVKHSRRAIKLLKDYGFKVEIHVMTDLPGATPEGDKECYKQILQTDPALYPDYMKDYPCLDVSYTEIKKWKQQGLWTPYAEKNGGKDLIDVLVYRQEITPKWVRVNRIQRDFKPVKDLPGHHIGFSSETLMSNLSQIVEDEAHKRGIYCKCIRCCEIGDKNIAKNESLIEYNITKVYSNDEVTEYFVSAEISAEIGAASSTKNSVKPTHTLLGFLRLRISKALNSSVIEELIGDTAMIRELHVYGKMQKVGSKSVGDVQHLGIGKKLLIMAEDLAMQHKQSKIAVISGIGVRDYYRKNGYELKGTYMVKDLLKADPDTEGVKDLRTESPVDPGDTSIAKSLRTESPENSDKEQSSQDVYIDWIVHILVVILIALIIAIASEF